MSLVTIASIANSALVTFAFATNTAFAAYRINGFAMAANAAAAMNVSFIGVKFDTGATGTVVFGGGATAMGFSEDLYPSRMLTIPSSSPSTVTIFGAAALTGTLSIFYDHY